MRSKLLVFSLAFAIPACSGDGGSASPTGPTFPDARGSFSGSWALEAVNLDTGASASCSDPGSITITTQSGSSFSGSFVINGSADCYGDVVSGDVVQGTIRSDGGLDFIPQVPGQQVDLFALLGCTGTSDDRLVGLLSGNRLTASGEATLTCFGETALIQVSVDVRR